MAWTVALGIATLIPTVFLVVYLVEEGPGFVARVLALFGAS
jgi:hypothetical protein